MTTRETPEPPRRRRRLTVLSVAAAVLLAGGGGAYWASHSADQTTDEDQPRANAKPDPEPLVLDGHGLTTATDSTDSSRSGIAPGEPDPQGADYRVSGELPKGPDSASVFRAKEGVSESEVAAIAAALDVRGTPRHSDGGWTVSVGGKDENGETGENDAKDEGPSLTVGDERSSGRWAYSHPAGISSQGADGSEQQGAGERRPVTEAQAESAVRPVLHALDLGGADLDASSAHDGQRVVKVRPQVGGLPTQDWGGSFTVGPDGELLRGHGQLGQPTQGDAYPVLTAAETLKQVPERGPISVAGVECADEGSPPTRGGGGQSSAETEAHGKPQTQTSEADDASRADVPCAAPAERKPRTVTDAEFGLDTQYSKGRAVLVPSWTYEVRPAGDGESHKVTYPAVEPEYLKGPNSESDGGDGGEQEARPPRAEPGGGGERLGVTSYATGDGSADRTLTLTFWGGVCHTYKGSVDASGKQVKVSIQAEKQKTKQACVQIAKQQRVKVTLDEPLGEREVVDARDGDPLPRSK
ncbi:hypothetical protein [Streptomyces oceani]|uniref:Large membrane protein n=1 Tax=Streptomyces oceani TaxID=1075402 RepID=A0A1E7KCX4_9ACTN|nr:hypothetical protein [Streptomyces oceani]OEV01697.1 hypothetical protein AN216_16835 [Streptomyces oceani]